MDYLNKTLLKERERSFQKSNEIRTVFNALIPGGSHTYAKGDDQFPEYYAPYIVKGKGCQVWDLDGNEYIEYGMGLRSVTLGHAFEPIVQAAYEQMKLGINFCRPSTIELECAEEFLSLIPNAEMVKFAKNGSDVTSAAVLLARAYTGRDMVGVAAQHPFFSFDDWFMGSTPISAGIPQAVKDLTVKFNYNDLKSAEELFQKYPNKIACLILEAEKEIPPANNFLHQLKALCEKNGALFILDEIITGFRWDIGGAQSFYNIEPHLSTFGKALGNGFSVSALAGKREIMELGGLYHDKERVFLLSATYGAENHGLAASLATMKFYQKNPVIQTLHSQGSKLQEGVKKIIEELKLEPFFQVLGKPWCMVYSTKDQHMMPSQSFRTLFLQETIRRGLIAPSLILSYSHDDYFINRTLEIIAAALEVYKMALNEGIEKYLRGRSVKPVFRKKN